MNKKLFLLLCVMALGVVLGVLTLRLSKLYAPPAVHPPSGLDVPSVTEPGHLQDSGGGSPVADVPATEKKTSSQHAVESWEKQIADVVERTDVPVNEQAKRVKQAFDKLA